MPKLPKDIADFMEVHGVMADEVWEVRPGTFAIKHKAIERIAAEKNISFEPPTIIEAKAGDKVVAMCVTGKMGERVEWSIGEATAANCKNSYFYAMAEKRGRKTPKKYTPRCRTRSEKHSLVTSSNFGESPIGTASRSYPRIGRIFCDCSTRK